MFNIIKKALFTSIVFVAWIFAFFNVSAMFITVYSLLGVAWIIFLICLFIGIYGKKINVIFK